MNFTDRERRIAAWTGFAWPMILVIVSVTAGSVHGTPWWFWLLLVPAIMSFSIIMGRMQDWYLAGQPYAKDGQIRFRGDPVHSARALAGHRQQGHG